MPTETVRGYRGGYLPRERREIERRLRDGEIRAVVATNALELGIDIGSLDAVVMAGYPGTIASTWQRAGRAGRRQGTSAAVLVASSAPLDQYIVEHPDYFFGRSPEHAYINPDNLEILLAHLKCAAFELPLRDGEKFGPHDIGEICRFLEESRLPAPLRRRLALDSRTATRPTPPACAPWPATTSWWWTSPASQRHRRGLLLHRAHHAARESHLSARGPPVPRGALRLRRAQSLREARGLRLLHRRHRLHPGQGAGGIRERRRWRGAARAHGDVRVNRQIVGFKKIKFYTMENVGAGKLNMPEQEMHTTAFWLHFPAGFLARFAEYTPTEKQSGIAGLGNALRTVAALLLMCDPREPGDTNIAKEWWQYFKQAIAYGLWRIGVRV